MIGYILSFIIPVVAVLLKNYRPNDTLINTLLMVLIMCINFTMLLLKYKNDQKNGKLHHKGWYILILTLLICGFYLVIESFMKSYQLETQNDIVNNFLNKSISIVDQK